MEPSSAEPRILGAATLASVHESVSRARSEVRGWLGAAHPVIDDVVLATSELVTNAITHSSSKPSDFIGLTLIEADDAVVVEVSDPGSIFSGPRVRKEPQSEHGRGLLIVREISLAWGTRELGPGLGRTVWCAIRLIKARDDAPTRVSG
ncbi:ATP-binding protein [Sphaerisporangium viridialbum]|uniref:ATP-binding protein n=1 Tax=Sphaerisporangium viridialbum TaxID=46189 RepID=UPI003C779762